MRTLEILLERRWILKDRERELYYKVKDDLGTVKKFLAEKLGYQVIVNPYLIKVEKMPSHPENWMGITYFKEKTEYVFFCLILMFLEEKDAGEQFVLSGLTEYIASRYREEQIDWTIYRYRRLLIRVMKYCVNCGMIKINDGSEEDFAREVTGEVLYENTGVSKYFMKNFTQNIMDYEKPEDFENEEWIGVNEDRGIVRRQRVYRSLLMSMGMVKGKASEEDFAYVRHYKNMIQGELQELFDCELQIHRSSAFLILGEECRMGRCFPEENTLSDALLLFGGMLREKIAQGEILPGAEEKILLPREFFIKMLEECKEKYGGGFSKTYREMTTREFCEKLTEYMTELSFAEDKGENVWVSTAVGKITGKYPDSFQAGRENDEQ